ncbi:MAG: hypothetical protein J5996_06965 [Prevotella sp.]|nr:hypothetical protein [Prevotella sp.]
MAAATVTEDSAEGDLLICERSPSVGQRVTFRRVKGDVFLEKGLGFGVLGFRLIAGIADIAKIARIVSIASITAISAIPATL